MSVETQTVEVGDLFRDNDRRLPGPRVVKVLDVDPGFALVVVVEHWDAKLVGRHSQISLERLRFGKNRQTGYSKVSR